VAISVIYDTLQTPGLAELMAEAVRPFASTTASNDLMQIAIIHGLLHAQVRGMARLGPEQQLQYLVYSIGMARSAEPEACRRMIEGKMGAQEAAAVSRRFASRMPLDQYESFLRLHLDALRADVHKTSHPRVFSSEELALSQQALAKTIRN
jgi:hypothetical protein